MEQEETVWETPAVITEIERLVASVEKRKEERQALLDQCDESINRMNGDLRRAYDMLRKALNLDKPTEIEPRR